MDMLFQTLSKFREKTPLLGLRDVHRPRPSDEKLLRDLRLKQIVKQKVRKILDPTIFFYFFFLIFFFFSLSPLRMFQISC